MKILSRYLALILLFCGLSTPLVSAHVLKQDNGVSAVLHIAPFDAPVSATPTRIEIEFSNTDNTFSLADYHIQLQMLEQGKAVQTYKVSPEYFGTAVNGLAVITFPKADVYTLQLRGTPLKSGTPAFVMDYEVRVTPGNNSPGAATNNQAAVLAIGFAAFILLVMFATRQISRGERYTNAKKGK